MTMPDGADAASAFSKNELPLYLFLPRPRDRLDSDVLAGAVECADLLGHGGLSRAGSASAPLDLMPLLLRSITNTPSKDAPCAVTPVTTWPMDFPSGLTTFSIVRNWTRWRDR